MVPRLPGFAAEVQADLRARDCAMDWR